MNRGLYNNVSAMLTLTRQMEVKSQNLANVNTTGYKYDVSTTKTFQDVLLSYKNQAVGELPTKIGINSIETVHSQGNFINTVRPLDLAISGDGFFKVVQEDGSFAYTRQGAFSVGLDGNLLDSNGRYVMGENGKINIPNPSDFAVHYDGSIYSNGKFVDKLDVVNLDNAKKVNNNSFIGKEIEGDYMIYQGYLEASNVDTAKELTEVITIQRTLSSNNKAFQTQDELNQKIIETLSK